MTGFNRNINISGLMKWAVLSSLILTFFGGQGGQEVPEGVPYGSVICSVDVENSAFESIYDFDAFLFSNVLADFEIEVENDDDHPDSSGKSSHPLSLKLLLQERTCTFFSPSQKLFILFHSWRSFLFV